jgi:hypothetical protein
MRLTDKLTNKWGDVQFRKYLTITQGYKPRHKQKTVKAYEEYISLKGTKTDKTIENWKKEIENGK